MAADARRVHATLAEKSKCNELRLSERMLSPVLCGARCGEDCTEKSLSQADPVRSWPLFAEIEDSHPEVVHPAAFEEIR